MKWQVVLDNGSPVAAVLWLLWLAWGLGSVCRRPLRSPASGFFEDLLLSLGLGLGLLSLLVLGLGLAGLYRPPVFIAVFAALSLAAVHEALSGWPVAGAARSRVYSIRALFRAEPFLLALLATQILLAGLTALSPPIFHDTLYYHLGLPNLYLLRGGIAPLPSVLTSNFPLGPQMVYLPALLLGGPQLANLVSFALGVLSSAAVAVFVRRHWGLRSALTAAVLYTSTPMWFSMARSATTDYALSFYYLMEVLCLYRWWEERRLPWVFSAGLFGGFAYGAKFTGGLFAVFLPALLVGGELLAAGRRRAAGSLLFRGLTVFLLACALSISPWLVKNLLFTGNPVYPALTAVFGGPVLDADRTRLLAGDVHAAWAVAGTWKDFLLLPWRLMAGDPNLGFAARTTWFFPIAVLAGIWLALTKPEWKERTLLILLSSFFLMWAATFWVARYLLPAVGLAAAVIAVALVRANPGFGKIWWAAVALLTFFNAAVIAADASNRRALRPALGLESRDNYLRTQLRAYPAIEFINRTLPRDARVLVVGEEKVAYLRRDHIYNTAYDTPVLKELLAASLLPEGLSSTLGARGVTHLLVNYVEVARLRRGYGTFAPLPDWTDSLAGLLEHTGKKLYAERDVVVYELP